MDQLADPLAGLDDLPWESLHHAYFMLYGWGAWPASRLGAWQGWQGWPDPFIYCHQHPAATCLPDVQSAPETV